LEGERMTDRMFTAWISKYALTEGVTARRVLRTRTSDDMVQDVKPDGSPGWGYFHKGDWHLTRDDAAAKAEQMRLRKINSVKKQLARLEALSFTNAGSTS
jgi:hypothetical protein